MTTIQIGRSSEEQIDFTIVDTWLASGGQNVPAPGLWFLFSFLSLVVNKLFL